MKIEENKSGKPDADEVLAAFGRLPDNSRRQKRHQKAP